MIGQARQQWQHRAILAPFTSPMHFLPGLGLQEYLQKPLLLTGYSVLDSTDDLMIKVTSYQAMAPSWRRVLFMILTRLPSMRIIGSSCGEEAILRISCGSVVYTWLGCIVCQYVST